MMDDKYASLNRKRTDYYIKKFCEFFSIFRNKKYIRDNQNQIWLFEKNNKYLSDEDVIHHLLGFELYSYVFTKTTSIFGFDIDCHFQASEKEKLIFRFNKYNFLKNNFGMPSLIFQSSSSQGLHLYYKIDRAVPFQILEENIIKKLKLNKSELKRKGIEIKPTTNSPLRLPYAWKEGGNILDFELKYLFPNKQEIKEIVECILKSNVYNYDELFFDLPENEEIENFKQQKDNFSNLEKNTRLLKYEKEIIKDLRPGLTNQVIENLAFNCFANGLCQDQAFHRINNIFSENQVPLKTDTRPKYLKQRIGYHFARFAKIRPLEKEKIDYNKNIDLFQKNEIESVYEAVCRSQKITHKSTQKVLKKILNNLYIWKNYIDSLTEDEVKYLSYKRYNYFYVNVKVKGLYPLPRNMLFKWSHDYKKFLTFLEKENVIKLGQNYGTNIKVCKYYDIDFLKKPGHTIILKESISNSSILDGYISSTRFNTNTNDLNNIILELHKTIIFKKDYITAKKVITLLLREKNIKKNMKYYIKCLWVIIIKDFKEYKFSCIKSYHTFLLIEKILKQENYKHYIKVLENKYLIKSFINFIVKKNREVKKNEY